MSELGDLATEFMAAIDSERMTRDDWLNVIRLGNKILEMTVTDAPYEVEEMNHHATPPDGYYCPVCLSNEIAAWSHDPLATYLRKALAGREGWFKASVVARLLPDGRVEIDESRIQRETDEAEVLRKVTRLVHVWRHRSLAEDPDGNPINSEDENVRLRMCASELSDALGLTPRGPYV